MEEFDQILVEIDRDFLPVVPGYLENRCSECTVIPGLLAAGDYEGIRLLGHRMKGSGGSYGFDEISEIGELLEFSAQECDAGGVKTAIESLKRYLDCVIVAYI